MTDHCQYVTASSVRVDILEQLSDEQTRTATVIETLDASQSAVYTALSDLEQRGLVREADDGWELTGRGVVVADTVSHRQATERFLGHDPDYWEDRQTDALPERFRLRLPEIGEYEIMRAEVPAVTQLVEEIVSRISGVDDCRIVSRVYRRRYEESLDSQGAAVLLTPGVIDQLLDRVREGRRERVRLDPALDVRVAPVAFSLIWTPAFVSLHLPPQTTDRANAMLVSETETAIQWGRDLHEGLWADAQPLADYLDAAGVSEDLRW